MDHVGADHHRQRLVRRLIGQELHDGLEDVLLHAVVSGAGQALHQRSLQRLGEDAADDLERGGLSDGVAHVADLHAVGVQLVGGLLTGRAAAAAGRCHAEHAWGAQGAAVHEGAVVAQEGFDLANQIGHGGVPLAVELLLLQERLVHGGGLHRLRAGGDGDDDVRAFDQLLGGVHQLHAGVQTLLIVDKVFLALGVELDIVALDGGAVARQTAGIGGTDFAQTDKCDDHNQ